MQPSILLIEDHLLLISLLLPLLQTKYKVTTARNPEQALAHLATQKFDLALLDLKLGESNPHQPNSPLAGIPLIPQILDSGSLIIVISAYCKGAARLACQDARIRGYINKINCTDSVLPIIDTVLAGRQSFPDEWFAMLAETALLALPPLNATEMKVLNLLMENPTRSNADISQNLFRSESRIKNCLTDLFQKFHCKGRYNLVNEARRRGYGAYFQLFSKEKAPGQHGLKGR